VRKRISIEEGQMANKNGKKKKLTTVAGAPVADNQNTMTAGPRGPALLQDVWFLEKLGHFDREVIPERRMHAKGSGAFGTFKVTKDVTRFTKAKLFSAVGKKTDLFIGSLLGSVTFALLFEWVAMAENDTVTKVFASLHVFFTTLLFV